jgi:hypothetical protein
MRIEESASSKYAQVCGKTCKDGKDSGVMCKLHAECGVKLSSASLLVARAVAGANPSS